MGKQGHRNGFVSKREFLTMWMLLLSCSTPPFPKGEWKLEGISLEGTGYVESDGYHAHIELYTDRFRTQGRVNVELESKDDILWLYFPLETGKGDGQAALRLQGGEAMLPLGSRRGEFEVFFSVKKSNGKEENPLQVWEERSFLSVGKEKEYWREGLFLFRKEDKIFGMWSGGNVLLFDEHWLTPEPTRVTTRMQGADIVLTFPIEPSFHGEEAMLRINVPLRQVSVPIAEIADPMDRQFFLEPGTLSTELQEHNIAQSVARSDELEEAFVVEQVRNIFSSGTCDELVQQDLNMLPLWKGYRLEWALLPDQKCSLHIEPTPPQHRRRLVREFVKGDI